MKGGKMASLSVFTFIWMLFVFSCKGTVLSALVYCGWLGVCSYISGIRIQPHRRLDLCMGTAASASIELRLKKPSGSSSALNCVCEEWVNYFAVLCLICSARKELTVLPRSWTLIASSPPRAVNRGLNTFRGCTRSNKPIRWWKQ